MINVKRSLLVGAILAASLASHASAQQGIRWQPTLDSAKRIAGQTNRLVLVHFWAEWCKPCAQMERDVFTRSDVSGSIESSFVPVKVNVDHFPATVREYGVSIVPTDVVITADGQLVDKLIGLADPAQYVARLNQIAANPSSQAADDGSQPAASAPAANRYQQPPANPYAAPAQSAADTSAPADDRYADYYAQRSQPAAATAAGPYANQWTPPSAATPSDPAASGKPSYQIPTSPYQAETASPYQAHQDPPTSPYGSDSSRYPSNPASPYQGAPESPNRNAASSPYDTGAAAPYQNYQSGAAPSYEADSASPYQSPASPPYEANAASPYQNPASSPYGAAGVSPYQSQTPSYQQDVANPRQQSVSSQGSPWSNSAAPAAETPLADQLPAGSPPLAMDGFCPVRLGDEEKWVKGDVRWGARHEGRTYLFAGAEEQQRFLAAPQQYAPALAGNDVVLAVEQQQMVPGHREHGVWYHGKVYLFQDETTCQRFNAAPEQYVNALEQKAGGMARRPAGSSSAGSAWQTYGAGSGGRY